MFDTSFCYVVFHIMILNVFWWFNDNNRVRSFCRLYKLLLVIGPTLIGVVCWTEFQYKKYIMDPLRKHVLYYFNNRFLGWRYLWKNYIHFCPFRNKYCHWEIKCQENICPNNYCCSWILYDYKEILSNCCRL